MTTVQTVINGIDTEALKQAMRDISADAAKGIAGFHVTTRWAGGGRAETSIGPPASRGGAGGSVEEHRPTVTRDRAR